VHQHRRKARNVHAVVTGDESTDAQYDAHHGQPVYGVAIAQGIESIDKPGRAREIARVG
jgi:hypothetical protein